MPLIKAGMMPNAELGQVYVTKSLVDSGLFLLAEDNTGMSAFR
jgi:hypothetical protein